MICFSRLHISVILPLPTRLCCFYLFLSPSHLLHVSRLICSPLRETPFLSLHHLHLCIALHQFSHVLPFLVHFSLSFYISVLHFFTISSSTLISAPPPPPPPPPLSAPLSCAVCNHICTTSCQTGGIHALVFRHLRRKRDGGSLSVSHQ